MRSPFVLVLMAGLALAGLAVYLVQDQFARQEAAIAEAQAIRSQLVPLTQVYAAVEPLRYGETLSIEKLGLIAWPKSALPEGVFTVDDAEALIGEGIEPRFVLRAMDAGEVLLASKVTEPGGEAGITAMLEPGMRAFSINVDAQTGVSGFLRPGDMVDVFWTGRIGERETTRLVGASMPLIAIDQNADMDSRDARIARTVSVMAPPAEVAALTHAQSTGRLTLSLVGVNDDARAGLVEIDDRVLFGLEDEPEPEPEPEIVAVVEPEVCTIRTRRGGAMAVVPIPCRD